MLSQKYLTCEYYGAGTLCVYARRTPLYSLSSLFLSVEHLLVVSKRLQRWRNSLSISNTGQKTLTSYLNMINEIDIASFNLFCGIAPTHFSSYSANICRVPSTWLVFSRYCESSLIKIITWPHRGRIKLRFNSDWGLQIYLLKEIEKIAISAISALSA